MEFRSQETKRDKLLVMGMDGEGSTYERARKTERRHIRLDTKHG